MTVEPQLFNIFFIIFLITITAATIIILRSNKVTSYLRKRQLNSATHHLLKSKDYRVINNICITTYFGDLQCDYLIVSQFGVFIVETFDHNGNIEGAEWQAIWKMSERKQKNKSFDNPLQQIERYKKILTNILGISKYDIFPIVVVTGAARFTSKLIENMTFGKGYLDFILGKKRPILSQVKTEQIINIIESEQLRSSRNKSVLKNTSSTKKQAKTHQCPNCGGDMIVELVESGSDVGQQLLRCTLYPTCRGSKTLV